MAIFKLAANGVSYTLESPFDDPFDVARVIEASSWIKVVRGGIPVAIPGSSVIEIRVLNS